MSDLCLREERMTDGDVLVDGKHQKRQRTAAERQKEGNQKDDNYEEAVTQTGDSEAREDEGRVVVHPQQDASDDVADGQIDQQRMMDCAMTTNVSHSHQRHGVEEDTADGQSCVERESGAVVGADGP